MHDPLPPVLPEVLTFLLVKVTISVVMIAGIAAYLIATT